MVQALSVAITLLRVKVQPAPEILICPAPGLCLKPGRFCRAWSSQARHLQGTVPVCDRERKSISEVETRGPTQRNW
ncbi:uncharacterized protein B0T23DRAFT_374367 [Neurospora hispaniola]|uniref:Uncharacterized protein n=1 Tax=Neurospora hispaniola TaxID=588809 RepID=A0AAJ0ID11_9PEZI|nr:hypothetical protein B0T23DRAFT_374367 [Neurospora hispaniola]